MRRAVRLAKPMLLRSGTLQGVLPMRARLPMRLQGQLNMYTAPIIPYANGTYLNLAVRLTPFYNGI